MQRDRLPRRESGDRGRRDLVGPAQQGRGRSSGGCVDDSGNGSDHVPNGDGPARNQAIAACLAAGKYVGICGQGPSDHPDFAQWLADEGIASISLNPDSVIATWQKLAE